jgi:hypothetical protein
MERIQTSTKSVDKFGAGKHGFTNGNPSTGTPSTQIDEAWCDSVQEELANAIEGAGLALNVADRTQLRQAIQAMIVGAQKAVAISNATFEASVADGEVVRWDSGNLRFDEAIADGSANNRAIGIADVTNAKVYIYGECPLFAGLTPGARYYLDAATAGAIATVAPADGMSIGIAKSATTLFVDIDALGARTDQKNSFTKAQIGTPAALPATTGFVTLDLATSNNFDGTLTGNITLANPSNIAPGQSGVIRIVNDATPRTIAYGSYWKASAGSLPALTATAGAVDLLCYYVESATRIWIGVQGDTK